MTNQNIEISNIEEIEEGNTLIRTGENTYSAIIPLAQINNGVTNTIRVTIEWVDSVEHSDEDIGLGAQSNPVLQIPVTVNVSQYLGETLTQYTI